MATNQATIEKMQKLKLFGMVKAFHSTMENGVKNNFTADELLGHLVDAEWDERHNRRLEKLIKDARFRYQASIEQIDFNLKRNLDKNMLLRFIDCDWINKKQNIIITGPTGVGKSFILSALGHQACIYGFKTLYYNCTKLFSSLKLKKADGSYLKELKQIQKQDVLILDDFGLDQFDRESRLTLLEIFEDRHGLKSTIITSQLPPTKWHEIIGDQTIADAICDRIIHSSFRIELKGESVRKIYKKPVN